jgi:DNA-binding response OmpR family regulator
VNADGRPTLLVAEDDPDLLELLVAALRMTGHEVLPARDGMQALALLRSRPIDLAVLDVLMPRMTGLEVVREVRTDTSIEQQPVLLMLSALCSRSDVRAGLIAGADDYLAKPFDLGELIDRVDVLLTERAVAVPSI